MIKQKCKRLIDILMTVGLLLAMGYQLWGDAAHEWIGAGMFILFIAHHILNINWYKTLFRGKYTPLRAFQLIINILTFAAMLALMYSGIVLSRYVFVFLPIDGGLALARRLHILGSHWGFILMSLHLGLHWGMILRGIFGKKSDEDGKSKARSVENILFAVRLIGLLIAGCGAFVFIKRDLLTYLLLKSEFVFLDYSEPALLFYIDYLALMGLFIFAAHYFSKLLQWLKRKSGNLNREADKK